MKKRRSKRRRKRRWRRMMKRMMRKRRRIMKRISRKSRRKKRRMTSSRRKRRTEGKRRREMMKRRMRKRSRRWKSRMTSKRRRRKSFTWIKSCGISWHATQVPCWWRKASSFKTDILHHWWWRQARTHPCTEHHDILTCVPGFYKWIIPMKIFGLRLWILIQSKLILQIFFPGISLVCIQTYTVIFNTIYFPLLLKDITKHFHS